MPGIATVAILNFLAFWSEYLFALILAGPASAVGTIQVVLPTLVSQTNTEYGVLAAGTLLTLIPVYGVYGAFQRRMEEALLSGAFKARSAHVARTTASTAAAVAGPISKTLPRR